MHPPCILCPLPCLALLWPLTPFFLLFPSLSVPLTLKPKFGEISAPRFAPAFALGSEARSLPHCVPSPLTTTRQSLNLQEPHCDCHCWCSSLTDWVLWSHTCAHTHARARVISNELVTDSYLEFSLPTKKEFSLTPTAQKKCHTNSRHGNMLGPERTTLAVLSGCPSSVTLSTCGRHWGYPGAGATGQ